MINKSICLQCGKEFIYVRYRTDKNYCSKECRNIYYYRTKGTYKDRSRRIKMTPEQHKEWKKNYDRQYSQQPEVRAKHNERSRIRYSTDEYRLYSRNRYYSIVGRSLGSLNHGYTSHRWFDLVRQYVGEPPLESSVYFDRWAERMGVAVLALLEGEDIQAAIKEHNRKEYIPEHMTIRLSDWKSDENRNPEERYFPGVESAESEALAKETVTYELKARVDWAKGQRRFGKAGSHRGRIQPARREGYRDYQDKPGHRR